LRIGFSAIWKGNESNTVLLDTQPHVDAVTDESKLSWHKYKKETVVLKQPSLQTSRLMSPAMDNMKVVTKLMSGPSMYVVTTSKRITTSKSNLSLIYLEKKYISLLLHRAFRRISFTTSHTTHTIARHIPNNVLLHNTICCHNTLLI